MTLSHCSKKVVVIATGGTIAMKYDAALNGLVPACTGQDLVEAIPAIESVADLEFIQFSNIASPGMTPDLMFDLHSLVEKTLTREDVAGVVITHGTDTLEETSYFLSLTHQSEKPVVLTAAMRGAGDLSPDGPMNILDAIRTAVNPLSRGKGVLVCLNDTLFEASTLMKTHSANMATFQAPWWGPIGYVDNDRLIYRFTPTPVVHFAPKTLTARVDLIKAVTGDQGEFVDCVVKRGTDAIVIEGFGRGNLPPSMMPSIERALAKGILVAVATRAPGGRVLGVYGYPGSMGATQARGVLRGGELLSAKLRLKLLIILSTHPELKNDKVALQKLLDE